MATASASPRMFAIDEVEKTYTLGTASGGGKRVGELIVSNTAGQTVQTLHNSLAAN